MIHSSLRDGSCCTEQRDSKTKPMESTPKAIALELYARERVWARWPSVERSSFIYQILPGIFFDLTVRFFNFFLCLGQKSTISRYIYLHTLALLGVSALHLLHLLPPYFVAELSADRPLLFRFCCWLLVAGPVLA